MKKRKEMKSYSPGFIHAKEIQKPKIFFYSVSSSLYRLCTCVCASTQEHARAQDPGKRKQRGGEKKATVCCSTFEASLSGLAAWFCVSKPHRAFHPLCCPRCVQCTEALCVEGDDTSHSVFRPELGVGVGGGGAIQEKEGDKKQTLRGPQLFKATMHKGL